MQNCLRLPVAASSFTGTASNTTTTSHKREEFRASDLKTGRIRTRQQPPNSAPIGIRCTRFVSSFSGEALRLSEQRGLPTAGRASSSKIRSAASASAEAGDVEMIGTVVLSKKYVVDLIDYGSAGLDNTLDLLGRKVTFQLISVDLDPRSNGPKVTPKSSIQNWTFTGDAGNSVLASENFTYKVKFKVPQDFGEPGAFFIRNNHVNEFYLISLTLQLPDQSTISFPCNSWVYGPSKYPSDRVFFSNKVYLPDATPPGLVALRALELKQLRGDGTGERVESDRIYDYDVYSDLGSSAQPRPVLGGSTRLQYPRRCRTGRPVAKPDTRAAAESPMQESNSTLVYVPRDERFNRVKNSGFLATGVKSVAHFIAPALKSFFDDTPNEFDSFASVKALYDDGIDLTNDLAKNSQTKPSSKKPQENPYVLLDTIFDADGTNKSVIHFSIPQVIAANDSAWLLDEEYGRETLAGMNPVVVKLVQEYPPKSSLDPNVYGSQGTDLTDQHILPNLEGMTVAQAMENKRLFIVDYHDIFMPYMNKINAASNRGKGYAPRTIFFHTSSGSFKPIAIELSLPPPEAGKSAIRRVFTPPPPGAKSKDYLWELAKVHASAIDFGYHELVTHWVRSHASMEPIIIASRRQLSVMHPIFTILLPLFKNTMNINAIARQALINANGIIELTFTPAKYSMEMSSVVYGATWQFDTQGLPKDLISRGMAEPADDSYPGAVKLVLDDYPFAKDGLDLWEAIEQWVASYVNIVYDGSDEAVQADTELQSWWNEIVNVGHGDKKDAPGWPTPNTIKSLVDIITTISWMAGPHHAAVNFGQYAYAGFMPNKPSMTRKFIPQKNSPEYEELMANPEKFILASCASETAATVVMATIELLATHAIDEEYQGQRLNSNWTSDPRVQAAFAEFTGAIGNLEKRINERNADASLVNRNGPTRVPYTLLFPSSSSGLTGRGVPYSVSI